MPRKKIPGPTLITTPEGNHGMRFISSRSGIELEVIKQKRGAATFEIRAYDDEERSESLIILLTKSNVDDLMSLLEKKLKIMSTKRETKNDQTKEDGQD